MDSDFNTCDATFCNDVEEAVDRGEATPCSTGGERSDSLSVLSHVEALVNACFPENAQDSGSGGAVVCEADTEEHQAADTGAVILPKTEPDSTAAAMPKASSTALKEPAVPGSPAVAHGTKRRLAAADIGEAEGEFGSLTDTKSSEPSSGEFELMVGTAAASGSKLHGKFSTAQVYPHSTKKVEVNNVPVGGPIPGVDSMPPENPMIRAVTRFLLDKVRQAASDSKLELRQALKADLERFKSDLSLKDRSKMRSRREAAVSRESRIAYTKGLEDLVLDLVRGNLLLLENQNMRVSGDTRHVVDGANACTASAAETVLAQTGNTSKYSPRHGDVSCPIAAPDSASQKAEEIAATSTNLGVSKGHQREEKES